MRTLLIVALIGGWLTLSGCVIAPAKEGLVYAPGIMPPENAQTTLVVELCGIPQVIVGTENGNAIVYAGEAAITKSREMDGKTTNELELAGVYPGIAVSVCGVPESDPGLAI